MGGKNRDTERDIKKIGVWDDQELTGSAWIVRTS
jgi:hypothetical protein